MSETQATEQATAETPTNSRVTIPDKKYAPEAQKTPYYKPKIPNYADKENTVKNILSWAQGYKQCFQSQPSWVKFKDTDMDTADEMWRASKTRTNVKAENSRNNDRTRSNVSSTSYNRTIRVITAGEMAVTLGNGDLLPMVYEPLPDAEGYREEEGLRIAEGQNMTLAYTMEASKMREEIRRIYLFGNKYGNQLCEMEWDYRIEERTERVPVKFEDRGEGIRVPIKFDYKTKKRIIADFPKLTKHDMKDVLFDAMIEDMQAQSCILIRKQRQLGDIWNLQKSGEFMNVGNITHANLYQGDSSESDVEGERQGNAGEETNTSSPTTLFDSWKIWIRVPVNDETGEWEPDKEVPHWYLAEFIGDLEGNAVCVNLQPNPHFCKQIPLLNFTSHDDDKGALHMGYAQLLECLYMMETTVLNLAFDNCRLRNRKPLILERGSISLRDKTFTPGGNTVWWKKAGSADPHEVDIQDTTGITIPMFDKIQDLFKETAGTNKPFLGEALGSRTSASEAISVLEQATKPALEDAKYKANQLLPFIALWNMEMWREFGDPKRQLKVTYQGEQREVNPTELWGPLNIKVTAVKRFQDNIIRRKEEDVMISQLLPPMISSGVVDKKGLTIIFKQILKNRDFDNVDEMFPQSSDYDAKHVAEYENNAILLDGVIDYAKPDENHDAHLSEHEPFVLTYQITVPKEEQSQENLQNFMLHIKQHKQFKSQADQNLQEASQQMGEPARTDGEAMGDIIGAEEGAAEQGSGRPPLIEQEV